MYLIEILLPLRNNEGRPFAGETYREVRDGLTKRFGGMTAFTRAPAEGGSKAAGGSVHDDIVIYEIMTQNVDREWWKRYREGLEKVFQQDEIVIRASAFDRL